MEIGVTHFEILAATNLPVLMADSSGWRCLCPRNMDGTKLVLIGNGPGRGICQHGLALDLRCRKNRDGHQVSAWQLPRGEQVAACNRRSCGDRPLQRQRRFRLRGGSHSTGCNRISGRWTIGSTKDRLASSRSCARPTLTRASVAAEVRRKC